MSAHVRFRSAKGSRIDRTPNSCAQEACALVRSGLEPLHCLPHMKVRCAVVQPPACHQVLLLYLMQGAERPFVMRELGPLS